MAPKSSIVFDFAFGYGSSSSSSSSSSKNRHAFHLHLVSKTLFHSDTDAAAGVLLLQYVFIT